MRKEQSSRSLFDIAKYSTFKLLFANKQIKRIRTNKDNLSNYKKLENAQSFSESHVYNLQRKRLEKLLLHAYHHVPYYRKILSTAEVIKDSNLIYLNNFTKIPLLDKKILHHNFEDLTSDDIKNRNWYENASGGSTGEPARFLQDKEFANWRSALKILFDRWSGFSPGDRKILLWGSERDYFSKKEKLRNRLSRWLRNETWFNTFNMTLSNMNDCVNTINTFKPVQLLGYVESIYELSCFIKRNHLKVFSPSAIMTTAGTLYPQFRETIGKVFNSPIYNRYGSREVGDIACECWQHNGLHVSMTTHYVEILKENGSPAKPGEVGEIVVTLLTNFVMPLIRYRIGDTGVWSEKSCKCGISWPLLKQITGRVKDTIIRNDGAIINGAYFTQLLYYHDWIQKFQVVQEDFDKIRFCIKTYDSEKYFYQKHSRELDKIKEKVKLVMGDSCEVSFTFVMELEPSPSGKYRYILSKVATPRF
jgi:phenylacetate-CoA ligase